jgi:hypothetical protein
MTETNPRFYPAIEKTEVRLHEYLFSDTTDGREIGVNGLLTFVLKLKQVKA